MKPLLSSGCAPLVGLSLLLAALPARATISVDITGSYGDLTITPSSGTLDLLGGLQNSAYAQAGANGDSEISSASASDVPASGALATGGAFGSESSGSSTATGYIPGTVAGYDTSEGQGSTFGSFEITGVTGPVNVNFSAMISGNLSLSSDNYGVEGRGEDIFTLSVNDSVVLGFDNLQTIGPSQSTTVPFSETLSGSMTLTGGTEYYLYAQSDSEALVVNSDTPAITPLPEPRIGPLLIGSLLLGAFVSFLRKQKAFTTALLGGGILCLAVPVQATYVGADKKAVCETCAGQPSQVAGGTINTSLSSGNNLETYPVVTVKTGYGPTLSFALSYNSYNADGSKAQLDTGLGFGWTHNYNSMLFQQRGQMFRLDEQGRITKYNLNYSSPGSYTSDTGYFETMTKQPDGSFIITNKSGSWWRFGPVPNSPFLIGGPVYQLIQLGDRNNNTTSLNYNGQGLLVNVTDPFGRAIQFTYNSSNKLSSVTDPLGRTTQFQYDSQYREMTQITDPNGRTVQYTYNAQDQITRKLDRDGRMYFYTYKYGLPFMVTDGSGQAYSSMTNPTNWSVNSSNLAYNLERTYNPSTTTVLDGNGRAWQYAYDPNGYVTQATAPDGATTRYTYDPSTLQVASTTDADGNTIRYTYDAEGNRLSMTDALGDVTTYTYEPVFNNMTSMTDPLGRTTTWQYDAKGNMLAEIDPLSQVETWTYDANGNVLTMTDKRGNITTNTYDSLGERISTTDPLGNTTRWQYDANGNVVSMTDPRGNTTLYQYDPLNRLTNSINPLDGITSWTYDSDGNRLTTTDPNGNTTSNAYDSRSRLIQTIDPLGGSRQYGYDANNNIIATTNQLGHVTTNAYDVQNRKIQSVDPLGNTTRWTYDPAGNQLSVTDPNTNTTHYGYDQLNRVISATNALSGTLRYDYATIGGMPCCSATPGSSLVTEMQDADGNITYYHYDELNRRTQVIRKNSDTNNDINPADAVTTTAYDANNNVIAVTDANGNTTTTTYDADNRRISMVDAAGDTTLYTYDGDGNVISTTDPNENITTTSYDALNRIITASDSIGLVRSNSYDANGNRISATDGLGHTTTYTYDGLNRRTSVTDPLGKTATTAYDADSNQISTTDRNGHTTTYTYDAMDRRVSVIDALGHTTATTYDPDNNILELTDPNGHVTKYAYDGLNRRISETYADPSPNTRTYSYDPAGNLIGRLDQDGRTTTYSYNALYYMTNRAYSPSGSYDRFTYDDGGRMLSANRNGWVDTFAYDGANRLTNTVQNGRPLTYIYDIPGRTMTNSQPSGRILTYTYDARNRLASIQDGSTNTPIVTYTYDDADRELMRAYRNGTASTNAYNANNWIISLDHFNATNVIAGFNYAYDNEGNKLYEQKLDDASASETYTYDSLNRMTNFDRGTLSGPSIPSPTLAKVWNLDPVGNWLTVVSNAVTESRGYGPANELTNINATVLAYDGDGNLTNDATYAYSYDEENRLTQIQRLSDSAIVGQYSYDALSRRVTQFLNPFGVSSTNVYFYDKARIIEEQDPAGATVATYTYGGYVDETLTMDRAGQTYYYHQDALYSPYALSDSTGTVVERYIYDAYGQVTVLDANYFPLALNAWGTPHSAVGNPYLFTGRQLDEESGLFFYRARYYDSVKGRFLQRDPLEYREDMNLYEYVRDNPANLLDPTGCDALQDLWKAKYLCCKKWEKVYQLWAAWGWIPNASAHCCAKKLTGENPFADVFVGVGLAGGGLAAEKVIEKAGSEILKKTGGVLARGMAVVGYGIGLGLLASYPINYAFCDSYMCSQPYFPEVTTGREAGKYYWSKDFYTYKIYKCNQGGGIFEGDFVRTWHNFEPGSVWGTDEEIKVYDD